jgi:hypothetical protein
MKDEELSVPAYIRPPSSLILYLVSL